MKKVAPKATPSWVIREIITTTYQEENTGGEIVEQQQIGYFYKGYPEQTMLIFHPDIDTAFQFESMQLAQDNFDGIKEQRERMNFNGVLDIIQNH